MGYSKMIIYGTNLDLYEYEKDIRFDGRRGKLQRRFDESQSLASSGEASLQPERPLKRADNARRASLAFSRLVSCNLQPFENPILITLTYSNSVEDIRQGYEDLRAFVGGLRYRFGSQFKYIAVPEWQKRGSIHFHALVWGLLDSLVISERSTRFLASLWGLGFVDVKLTDGDEKIAGYMAKYMSKSFMDSRLSFHKSYVCSRNCIRPEIHQGGSALHHLLSYYLPVDKPPLLMKTYDTQWLGKGRYSKYKIN